MRVGIIIATVVLFVLLFRAYFDGAERSANLGRSASISSKPGETEYPLPCLNDFAFQADLSRAPLSPQCSAEATADQDALLKPCGVEVSLAICPAAGDLTDRSLSPAIKIPGGNVPQPGSRQSRAYHFLEFNSRASAFVVPVQSGCGAGGAVLV